MDWTDPLDFSQYKAQSPNTKLNITATPPPLRKKEVCSKLQENKFCSDQWKDKCNHPRSAVICRDVYMKDGCSKKGRCDFMHPRREDIEVENLTVIHCRDDEKKSKNFLRRTQFLVPKNMKSDVCANGIFCSTSKCPKQHFLESGTSISSLDRQETARSKMKGTLHPASISQTDFVKRIWNERSKGVSKQIVKVEKVYNKDLDSLYERRRREIENKGTLCHEVWAYHGSPNQNMQAIVDGGFRVDKQINNAHGRGTYFAYYHSVSVSYSRGGNQMLMCRLLCHEHIHVDQSDFYILPNTAGILPEYLITFQ